MVTTAQTPALEVNEAKLMNEVLSNREAILENRYTLKEKFQGGMALMPSEDFLWFENTNMEHKLKVAFSMITCNGCHAGATETRFAHIEPRELGLEAVTSIYLQSQVKKRAEYIQDIGRTIKAHHYIH